jgi:hypothetical protein
MIDTQDLTNANAGTRQRGSAQYPSQDHRLLGQILADHVSGCKDADFGSCDLQTFTTSLVNLSRAVAAGKSVLGEKVAEPPRQLESCSRRLSGISIRPQTAIAEEVRVISVKQCDSESIEDAICGVSCFAWNETIEIDFSQLVGGHWDCLSLSILLDRLAESTSNEVRASGWQHLFKHVNQSLVSRGLYWYGDHDWLSPMLALQSQFEDLSRKHQSILRRRTRVSPEGESSRIASACASLLTLVAICCASLALWRVGTDLNLAGDFVLQSGLLSHWQVWTAASVGMPYASLWVTRLC